jgi:hypothetical protein
MVNFTNPADKSNGAFGVMRIGMGKSKYCQCCSVHRISYMNRLGSEPGPARLEVGRPPEL